MGNENFNPVIDALTAPTATDTVPEVKGEIKASNQAQVATTPSPEPQTTTGSADFKSDPDFQALLGEKK